MKKIEVWALKLNDLAQLERLKWFVNIEEKFKIENWEGWKIGRDKYVFVFEWGVLVLMWLSDEEYEKLFKKIGEINVIEREVIQINPREEKLFKVVGGKITLSKPHLPALEVLALVLAISVSLEYFEEQIDKLMDKVNFHKEFLEAKKVKFKDTQMLKIWAQVLDIKKNILNELYVVDKPEIVWEDPVLESFYERLFSLYDIGERFEAIEYKIDFINEVISFVHEWLATRKDHFLERIIILLIAFEIVVYLIELFFKI